MNIVVFIESARTILAREGGADKNELHLASLLEVSAAWGTCATFTHPAQTT